MSKQMGQLLTRYAPAIIVGAIIIVGTLGIILIVMPAYDSFIYARDELRQANSALQSTEDRLAHLASIETVYENINPDDAKKISAIFVTPPELATIVHALDTAARKSRWALIAVDIVEGRVGAADADKESMEIAIQAQLKGGGYAELRQFLAILAKMVPLLDVSSFSFNPDNTSMNVSIKAKRPPMLRDILPALDRALFEDPRIKTLNSPLTLPPIGNPGLTNPFAGTAQNESAEE